MAEAETPTSVNIIGVRVNTLNVPQTLDAIQHWLSNHDRQYVCVANVYTLIECRRSPAFRQVYRMAGLVTPDGMPLVWFSHLKGQAHVRRVYGPDLMLAACARFPHYRHFFYGTNPRTLERLTHNLRERFPNLQIAGTFAPPFYALAPIEVLEIIKQVNACAPDIVWVSLGAPKQERWMADQRAQLSASVLIGVGAAFDYHAGVKPQAPHFMQRIGLEWLFRLLTEPARLWKRYVFSIPPFVVLAAAQLSGLRCFDFLDDER